MRAPLYPNPIDIIVVMMTCLSVVVLAFPLSAAERLCPEVEVFDVEFSTAQGQGMKSFSNKKAVVKRGSSPQLTAGVGAATTKQGSVGVSMEVLKQRLKNSNAIGMFSKLEIRSDIVGLADDIHRYRTQGVLESRLGEVRNDFDGLIVKIVKMLEADPVLSRDIYAGRESIWSSLMHVDV